MIGLNCVSDESYIMFRTENLSQEEYDEILDLVKQVLRRKKEKRIIEELQMGDCWKSLR